MLYLAYGSNLHPARLQARVPSARVCGTMVLEGWRLDFHKRSHDGSGKCSITRTDRDRDSVHAAIFEIDPEQRVFLNRAEGLGAGYEIEHLDLPDFGEVFTYIASPVYIDPKLKPYEWYRWLVLKGCEYHNFPVSYVEGIREVEAWKDPDRARHERHMAILPE